MKLSVSSLAAAIRDGNIVPYFQPLVGLRSRAIEGFEALARLAHPRLGVLLPGEFLPAAESAGIMHEITRSLIEKSMAVATKWSYPYRLSINVTADQLQDASLVMQLDEIAASAHFPLDRLTIEVTETFDLSNLARVQESIERLKSAHVALALDDVGIGYSSLRYLQIFPFDILKIDMAFVRALTEDEKSRRIVRALIDLGHALNLTVVAEGIETPEQAEVLEMLGCDIGQGWLFGRPISASMISSALGAWVPQKISIEPSLASPTAPDIGSLSAPHIFDRPSANRKTG